MNNQLVAVIMGIPGAGKTTLSMGLAAELGWERLSRDDVREELGLQTHPEGKNIAWQCLLSRLAYVLGSNKSALVEGMPFSKISEREEVFCLAKEMNASVCFLFLECPPIVAEERIIMSPENGAIDRTRGLAFEVAARFEPVIGNFIRLDATLKPKECLFRALEYIDRHKYI